MPEATVPEARPPQAATAEAGTSDVPAAVPPAPAMARPRGPVRVLVSVREVTPRWFELVVTLSALLLSLAVCAVILVGAGVPADKLADEFIVSTLLDSDNLRAVLAQAAPLILVGVGATVAFRVRFWNLGLEGQMICGSVAATAIALFHVGPDGLRLLMMAAAAAVAGALWAIVPGLLKVRLGVNEIISSLLLNYVAQNFLLHLLYGSWKDPKMAFPHSPEFGPFERLPEIGWGIGAALPIAVIGTLLAGWLVGFTRTGVYMRFVQTNASMARATGLPVVVTTLAAVLVSGSFAALAGYCLTAGQEGRLTQSFFVGYGFSGILIAFLARNNPPVAMIVAVLVATLFVTGQSLQVFYQIPFAMVRVIQAIVIIGVAASEFLLRYQVRLVR